MSSIIKSKEKEIRISLEENEAGLSCDRLFAFLKMGDHEERLETLFSDNASQRKITGLITELPIGTQNLTQRLRDSGEKFVPNAQEIRNVLLIALTMPNFKKLTSVFYGKVGDQSVAGWLTFTLKDSGELKTSMGFGMAGFTINEEGSFFFTGKLVTN